MKLILDIQDDIEVREIKDILAKGFSLKSVDIMKQGMPQSVVKIRRKMTGIFNLPSSQI